MRRYCPELCRVMKELTTTKGRRESFRPLKWNENYLIGNKGRIFSLKSMRCIGNFDSQGYWNVCIDGKHYCAHRLIYTMWIGDIPPNMDVNHDDGNPRNNVPSNYTLMTRSENIKHSCEVLGRTPKGKDHYRWSGFWEIKGNKYLTLTTAAKETGISIMTIRFRCKRGIKGCDFIPAERCQQMTA